MVATISLYGIWLGVGAKLIQLSQLIRLQLLVWKIYDPVFWGATGPFSSHLVQDPFKTPESKGEDDWTIDNVACFSNY